MATQPDQWIDKTTWVQVASAQTFLVQVLEGMACLCWSDQMPADEYLGLRLGHGQWISGEGDLWAKSAFTDVQTQISVSTDITIAGIALATIETGL